MPVDNGGDAEQWGADLVSIGRVRSAVERVLIGGGWVVAVVAAALNAAWAKDCHHVLLQSGRKDQRVHRFYERCGFVVEGVLRGEFHLDGEYVDDVLMALDLTG